MKNLVVFLAIFGLCFPLYSQVTSRQADSTKTLASPLVTAQASGDQIRFTALTVGSRMRLEVLSPTGETLIDTNFKPGNLIEWQVDDQRNSRLSPGVYGCLVTVEELSGRVTYRRGLLRIGDGQNRNPMQRMDCEQGPERPAPPGHFNPPPGTTPHAAIQLLPVRAI